MYALRMSDVNKEATYLLMLHCLMTKNGLSCRPTTPCWLRCCRLMAI